MPIPNYQTALSSFFLSKITLSMEELSPLYLPSSRLWARVNKNDGFYVAPYFLALPNDIYYPPGSVLKCLFTY